MSLKLDCSYWHPSTTYSLFSSFGVCNRQRHGCWNSILRWPSLIIIPYLPGARSEWSRKV